MSTFDLWIIVLSCSAGTFMWRFFGVLFSQRINVDGWVFEWVSCVSYAMVAGLIFRLLILPDNVLESVSLSIRSIAIICGFIAYFVFSKMILPGVIVGSVTLGLLVHFGVLV